MLTTTPSNKKKSSNILLSLHEQLTHAPTDFRQKVCEECGYSIPTYYRKMRRRGKNDEYPMISKAEAKAILDGGQAVVNELQQYINECRKQIL